MIPESPFELRGMCPSKNGGGVSWRPVINVREQEGRGGGAITHQYPFSPYEVEQVMSLFLAA